MISNGADQSGADALPPARLGVSITWHRAGNSAYDANRLAIEATLGRIVDSITDVLARQQEVTAPARLHSLLANGADLLAVEHALERGWEIVAPLPFGFVLNTAINAHPGTAEDAVALLEGRPCSDLRAAQYAARAHALARQAKRFKVRTNALA